jgi:KilA-N domain
MAKKTLIVEGSEISILQRSQKDDYISLTDIMKRFDDEFAIYSWMRNKNTVEFLGVWELLHNEDFKGNEFVTFKNEAGSNNFNLTPKKWIEATGAIGLITKSGKYGGGTYAHRDIAIHFCSWLSPTFQLYLVKEFQRLKEQEALEQKEISDWNLKRTLAKVNYRVHTDAVKMHLIPPRIAGTNQEGIAYASEADILNLALFGVTAKQWREANPELKGNIRDHASAEQLLVLVNLENLNAHFIKDGLAKDERLVKLNEIAIYQLQLLSVPKGLQEVKQLPGEADKANQ